MDAAEYYARNAVQHGGAVEVALSSDGFKLTANPSEVDHAIHWLLADAGQRRSSILDIGCAQLTLLRRVEGQFARRVGTDITNFPIWRDEPGVETCIHNLDTDDLPFEDGSFDAVTMLMVLEHVFDPFHAVREIRRVLSPTGKAVVAVPNLACIKHRLRLAVGRLPITSTQTSFAEGSWDGYHLHNFTMSTLDWLLRREGLKPVAWAAQGRMQWLKRLRPSLFGADLVALCCPAEPEAFAPSPK